MFQIHRLVHIGSNAAHTEIGNYVPVSLLFSINSCSREKLARHSVNIPAASYRRWAWFATLASCAHLRKDCSTTAISKCSVGVFSFKLCGVLRPANGL